MTTPIPHRAFYLLGPTAVGKSELAVALAERVGGEIVGADAFQIYRGLDVLSAKPSAAQRARVPHHLVGEVPLSEAFDVAKYRALAEARIADIIARGRVPIVCGGTGLYIRALTHGLSDMPSADAALRAGLEKESLPALVARLRALDPASAVDMQNPRRVIRALEVCILSGRPFSSHRSEWENAPNARGVILSRSREDIAARIGGRSEIMFAEGVVEEVAAIGDVGPTAAQMLGLREIRAVIAGEIPRAACIAAIALATRQYAKRQMTWFRRERSYEWLDLTAPIEPLETLVRVALEVRDGKDEQDSSDSATDRRGFASL